MIKRTQRALTTCEAICVALACSLSLPAPGMAATDEAAACGAASMEELIRDATRYGTTPEKKTAKEAARNELFARGTNTLQVLMEYIHVENTAIQLLAQEEVERLDAKGAAAVLLPFLESPQPRTRRFAAFFLGWHNTPEYTADVAPLLRDAETAGAALRTLGKWKARAVIPAILPFLKDSKETLRAAAVNALRDIGDASVVPHLIDMLDDPFFTVRETAQQALEDFGPAAEPAMIRALSGAHDGRLRHLVRGLGHFRTRTALRAVRKYANDLDPETRADVREAMARPRQ